MKPAQALALIILMIACGCKKNIQSATTTKPQTIPTAQVDPAFNFNTAAEIPLRITTLDNADHPVPGIRFTIYTDYPENGGNAIMKFNTGSDAVFNGILKVPACSDSVVIGTSAIGFVQWQKRSITGQSLNWILGGKSPQVLKNVIVSGPDESWGHSAFPSSLDVNMFVQPLSGYNTGGVPNDLASTNDVVDASFLADINNALPEYRPVPSYHPEYLLSTNQANLSFQQAADVWVTFVHEGTGYRNVLCFYKYQVNHPPVVTTDIDTLYAVFPNVSFVNSGGGLVSGNKVNIGAFQPGTEVGWALIADGYNGSGITKGNGIYYSQPELNPERNVNLKKHCILLNDIDRGKLLLSFEDLNRQNGSDNDFNDAVFYVTANPIQALNLTNVASCTKQASTGKGKY